ncbi:MAG: hypothetical protein BM556_07430 [Bacteriovorax sp. MedPE-SWde]|nr:MAG: hypothetical protein BM556_07430 [Bacteriovorax sp. MedPE-SWde]
MRNEFVQIKYLIQKIMVKNEFLYILAVVYFFLMTWPFVSVDNMNHPKAIIVYIFCIWGSLIFILFCISRIKRKMQGNKK